MSRSSAFMPDLGVFAALQPACSSPCFHGYSSLKGLAPTPQSKTKTAAFVPAGRWQSVFNPLVPTCMDHPHSQAEQAPCQRLEGFTRIQSTAWGLPAGEGITLSDSQLLQAGPRRESALQGGASL